MYTVHSLEVVNRNFNTSADVDVIHLRLTTDLTSAVVVGIPAAKMRSNLPYTISMYDVTRSSAFTKMHRLDMLSTCPP